MPSMSPRKDFHHEPPSGQTLTALSVYVPVFSLGRIYPCTTSDRCIFAFHEDIIARNLECVKGVLGKSFMLTKHHASAQNLFPLKRKTIQHFKNFFLRKTKNIRIFY